MNAAFILSLFLGIVSADESAPLSALFDGRGVLEEFAKPKSESSFFSSGLNKLNSIAFSEDGGRILMAGSGGALMGPWDPNRLEKSRTQITTQPIEWAALSRDGSRAMLVTPGPSSAIQVEKDLAGLYDTRSGRLIGSYKVGYTAVSGVFSPDGSRAALFAFREGWIKIVDAATGDIIRRLHVDGKGVAAAFFSADNRALTTINFEGKVDRWDLESKWPFGRAETLAVLTSSPFFRAYFNRDHSKVAIDTIGTVEIWDTRGWNKLTVIPNPCCYVNSVSFSPGDHALAMVLSIQSIAYPCRSAVWDVQTGRKLLTLDPEATAVSYSPDGRLLVGVGDSIEMLGEARALKSQRDKLQDFLSRQATERVAVPAETAEERFKLR